MMSFFGMFGPCHADRAGPHHDDAAPAKDLRCAECPLGGVVQAAP
jgi:hypothetical protein